MSTENKTFIGHISGTLNRARQVIPEKPTVGHTHIGTTEKPEHSHKFLESANHSWWIGKIIRRSTLDHVRKTLGMETDDGLYSEAFLEASIEYLLDHLGENESANIIDCRILSELFNGVKDVEQAYSNEEIQAKILRIAKKKFPKGSADKINIVRLEELPQHKALFEHLNRFSYRFDGTVSIESAFSEPIQNHLTSNPNSLEIALYLFQKAKENNPLFQRLKRTNLQRHANPDWHASNYYGLIEIAIRLSEIIQGQNIIHGGADRQGKYDDLIEEFFKESQKEPEKRRSTCKNLDDLLNILKDKHFETLHLQTSTNPHQLKRDRRLARAQLGGSLLFTAFLSLAAYQQYQNWKSQKLAQYIDKFDESAKDTLDLVNMNTIHGPHYFPKPPREEVLSVFEKSILNQAMNQICERYDIAPKIVEELRIYLKIFLIKHSQHLNYITENCDVLSDLIDLFMQEERTAIILANHGISPQKPYSNILSHKALIHSAAQIPAYDESELGEEINEKRLKKIGSFMPIQDYYINEYELFTYTDNKGNNHLLAREITAEREEFFPDDLLDRFTGYSLKDWRKMPQDVFRWWTGSMQYEFFYKPEPEQPSKQMGKIAAQKFIDLQRRFAIQQLISDADEKEFLQLIYRLCDPNYVFFSEKEFTEQANYYKYSRSPKLGRFEDPFGEFSFDLVKYQEYQPEANVTTNHLLAKYPEEDIYSSERAQEFAAWYLKIMRSHWSRQEPGDICYLDQDTYTPIPPNSSQEICIDTGSIDLLCEATCSTLEKILSPTPDETSRSYQKQPAATRKIPDDESLFRSVQPMNRKTPHVHRKQNR